MVVAERLITSGHTLITCKPLMTCADMQLMTSALPSNDFDLLGTVDLSLVPAQVSDEGKDVGDRVLG